VWQTYRLFKQEKYKKTDHKDCALAVSVDIGMFILLFIIPNMKLHYLQPLTLSAINIYIFFSK
jgi:hypothetical protein